MFWRRKKVDRLRGIKTVRVRGMKFVIRRVNPLLDFPADKMPQIFEEAHLRRPADTAKPLTAAQIENMRSQVLSYIRAGVIDPPLVPLGTGDRRGKEDGITADDLFRDPDMGMRLYFEILHNSLNVFSGLQSVFFSIRTRLFVFTFLRLNTRANQLMSFFQTESRLNSSGNSSTVSSSA